MTPLESQLVARQPDSNGCRWKQKSCWAAAGQIQLDLDEKVSIGDAASPAVMDTDF